MSWGFYQFICIFIYNLRIFLKFWRFKLFICFIWPRVLALCLTLAVTINFYFLIFHNGLQKTKELFTKLFIFQVPRSQTKLTIMLEKLGMDYDGRPHSGLDDSKNIARIAVRMLQDGCELRINEKMHAGQLMSVSSSLPIEGTPAPQMPHSRK